MILPTLNITYQLYMLGLLLMTPEITQTATEGVHTLLSAVMTSAEHT